MSKNKFSKTKIKHFINTAPFPYPWLMVTGIYMKTNISRNISCSSYIYCYYNDKDNIKHYFCANISFLIKTNENMSEHSYRNKTYNIILGDATSIEELALQFCNELYTVVLLYNGECYTKGDYKNIIRDYKKSKKCELIFTNISNDQKFTIIEYKPCIPYNIIPYYCILSDATQILKISLQDPSFVGIKDFFNNSHSINNIELSKEFKKITVTIKKKK